MRTGTEGSVAGVGGILLSACSASANYSLSSFLENFIDLPWAVVWVYPWTSQLWPRVASSSPDSAAGHPTHTTLAAPGEARQAAPTEYLPQGISALSCFLFPPSFKDTGEFLFHSLLGEVKWVPAPIPGLLVNDFQEALSASAILLSLSSNSSLWVVPFVTCVLHQFFAYISFFLYWCFCSF